MTPVRVLVVDDEPLARARVQALLAEEPEVEVVGEAGDARDAEEAIRTRRPDVVFLDIQLPDASGFDLLAALEPEHWPVVVFVTAYDRHALEAFDVHAVDYVLKPFDEQRFHRALARAVEAVRQRSTSDLPSKLAEVIARAQGRDRPLRRIVVKEGGRVTFVSVDEVTWIEAAGNYARLHCTSSRHLLREKMHVLESKLDPDRFVRIHRSTIVNLERVRELVPCPNGDCTVSLVDGTKLVMSRGYRAALQEHFGRSF